LKTLGYTAIEATSPRAAIDKARDYAGDIHLLITDVIMPEMNGRNLANAVQALHPEIERLFISGYTAEIFAPGGVLEEGVHFLQKPFSLADPAGKLAELPGDRQ
jgi:two-component system, cell cycle sensor histidine kinase and response regulator CckA